MTLSRSALASVTEFARAMGLEPQVNDDGSCSFDFAASGRLSVTSAEDGAVLVSLTRRVILEGLRNLATLIGESGIDPADGTACHAGLNRAGQPVLILRCNDAALDGPRLEAAHARLAARFEALGL